MDTIGVICEPDDAVFGPVAERLAARGFDVHFFQPGEPVGREAVGGLDALVNGRLRRRSFAALRLADELGVETWNGFFPSTALSSRPVALHALAAVGCRVPELRFEPREGYVRRARFRYDVPPGADAPLYQERVRAEPVIERYCAVDDGVETHLTALRVRSELTDQGAVLAESNVAVERAARVRELLDRFSARALVVDFVRDAEDRHYAVDVDPAPSFSGTGMDRRVADSMASLTTIGA